jgi:hypothetical protein
MQVVVEDLRADLPGNDPAATAATAAKFRAEVAAAAQAAVEVRGVRVYGMRVRVYDMRVRVWCPALRAAWRHRFGFPGRRL